MTAPTTTTQTQREFAQLYREKLELQDRMNDVNKRIEELQEPLQNYFADMGENLKRVEAEAPSTEVFNLLRAIVDALRNGSADDLVPLLEQADTALAPMRLTLYIDSKIWANTHPESDVEAAVASLKAHGFGDFVAERFNVQTLSSKAREMDRNGEAWPEAVLKHIKVAPKIQILGRRN